ncbi:hypothetical protein KHS38_08330 [Mucilaginibacter sp. Bleaf8]|uniref:hypothetical protein n=1 Tax=Mucilaginibacter sp. Bleaf8 TaxID=2834430 RepID=UPI001BCB9CCB|nr:hypothetical protein [Mucilaginibacter sp. Bleaf8]MBS7564412.1 hypothetical protein [Mucilaginibacter sp. Bleaf8]
MMKQTLLVAILVAGLFMGASAQSKYSSGPKLSIGLDFGVPTGSLADGYSIGFGGNGKVEIPVAPAFNFTLTAGYISYYYKDEIKQLAKYFGEDTYTGFVPLKAGGKYYFSPNFYGEGELGALIGTNNNAGTSFVYSPGIGVSFPVTNKNDIDFGVRYEGWSQDGSTASQVAFRIAYKFGL